MSNILTGGQSNAITVKTRKSLSKSGPCKACILNAAMSNKSGAVKIPPCHPNCKCKANWKKQRV